MMTCPVLFQTRSGCGSALMIKPGLSLSPYPFKLNAFQHRVHVFFELTGLQPENWLSSGATFSFDSSGQEYLLIPQYFSFSLLPVWTLLTLTISPKSHCTFILSCVPQMGLQLWVCTISQSLKLENLIWTSGQSLLTPWLIGELQSLIVSGWGYLPITIPMSSR